jgi:hypothetical protein
MTALLLNQIELSKRWGVSERTLEAWRWRGRGPKFIRIGKGIRYRVEDILQFEASQERDPSRDKSSVMS